MKAVVLWLTGSIVSVLCLVVHHKSVLYEVETVRLRLVGMSNYLSHWREGKEGGVNLFIFYSSPTQRRRVTKFCNSNKIHSEISGGGGKCD